MQRLFAILWFRFQDCSSLDYCTSALLYLVVFALVAEHEEVLAPLLLRDFMQQACFLREMFLDDDPG